MKFNGDHVYFYLGWNGLIIAVYGKLFKRDIDIQLTLTLHGFFYKEVDNPDIEPMVSKEMEEWTKEQGMIV